jgi:hypothetical protein
MCSAKHITGNDRCRTRETVSAQFPCLSNACAGLPPAVPISCTPDDFPCPVRSTFGTCLCGPTSTFGRCEDSIDFCDRHWDGSFCSNSSTLVRCYGGRTVNSTNCSAPLDCNRVGVNSSACGAPSLPPPPVKSDQDAPVRKSDDWMIFPTSARCRSRWSGYICASDVVLADCATGRYQECYWGCMETESGGECRCNCGDDAYGPSPPLFLRRSYFKHLELTSNSPK